MTEPRLDCELRGTFAPLGITSCSPNVMAVLRHAQKAAEVSDVNVLIQGETGTGKQLLAQGIHQLDCTAAGIRIRHRPLQHHQRESGRERAVRS
jgi:hypothetical protein